MPSKPSKPIAVVLNPIAGSGAALRQWPKVRAALEADGWTPTVYDHPHEAAYLPDLPSNLPVLAVGGDGTIHRLLPHIGKHPLGLMPLGTGNDYAGMLGLTPHTWPEAVRRLKQAPHAADLLRCTVNGETHLLHNGLGMGFDSQVTVMLAKSPKKLLGVPLAGLVRYLIAFVRAFGGQKSEWVEVWLDGELLYGGRACLVAVMNGTRYGGGFLISPASDLFDGHLNVVIGRELGKKDLLELLFKVLRGTHLPDPRVVHSVGQQVEVKWQKPTEAHLDGDLIGPVTSLSAEIVPAALNLLSWHPQSGKH